MARPTAAATILFALLVISAGCGDYTDTDTEIDNSEQTLTRAAATDELALALAERYADVQDAEVFGTDLPEAPVFTLPGVDNAPAMRIEFVGVDWSGNYRFVLQSSSYDPNDPNASGPDAFNNSWEDELLMLIKKHQRQAAIAADNSPNAEGDDYPAMNWEDVLKRREKEDDDAVSSGKDNGTSVNSEEPNALQIVVYVLKNYGGRQDLPALTHTINEDALNSDSPMGAFDLGDMVSQIKHLLADEAE